MTRFNVTLAHSIKSRLLTSVTLALTLLATLACTTTEPVTPRYTSSLVSVREPGFEFLPGESYNWLGEIEVLADTGHSIKESTIKHLRDTLERDLTASGHPKVSSGADYLLAATIIVGNSVSESELIERYDISPSLMQQADYEAGTLVLRVINPASLRTEWRAAMELFTDPNETDAERIAKVDKAIDAFIRQLGH
ncbi:hypothetical protein [uncultured Gilvimarinus sp.]|uniref:hypothetical protein n=1 Tax=uncultured Gilvimarinus sp. TaxID=1689143 RepID=UPI0030EB8F9D|tara:strand:- start:2256 stop:2840 length:585 start_codon:yes stop_codon:yes gene_type:complete